MTTDTRARRRPGVSRDMFRAAGRRAAEPYRRDLSVPARVALAAVLGAATLLIAARGTAAVLAGWESFGREVGGAIPQRAPTSALVLPEVGPGTASGEPIFDDLPTFTAEQKLRVTGRVPTFALARDRQIDLVLNGAAVGRFALDSAGRFAADVTLRDGANALQARLVGSQGETIASTSATVVLDKAAPPLTIAKPKSGETVDGPNVSVEGKAAPRAQVRVNSRIVAVNPDGSFADAVPLPAGAQTITIIARNEAGVETTSRVAITVRAAPAAARLQLAVALNAVRARPGDFVIASVVVTDAGAPARGVSTRLSIGVVDIGSAVTDASGRASFTFAAPDTEGDIAVVVLAGGSSARASLLVSKTTPRP